MEMSEKHQEYGAPRVVHTETQRRPSPPRRTTRRVLACLVWHLPIAFAPTTAVADPLEHVMLAAALPAEIPANSQVLDDDSLSGIRGRGADGTDLSAPSDVAVILWDELGGRQRQGQQGTSYSQRSGTRNVQSNTMTMQGY